MVEGTSRNCPPPGLICGVTVDKGRLTNGCEGENELEKDDVGAVQRV